MGDRCTIGTKTELVTKFRPPLSYKLFDSFLWLIPFLTKKHSASLDGALTSPNVAALILCSLPLKKPTSLLSTQ